MKLLLRPAAVDDIRAAREYYADADPGLAERLAEDLDRLFAMLEAFPRSASVVEGYESVRRALLRRFPYAVFYRFTEPDRIDVLRVVHTARSPATWPEEST
ncbi:MAG TPA: type II toxin-antitoxin system RelE/ParE family toxin [Euzebyales bacterium]